MLNLLIFRFMLVNALAIAGVVALSVHGILAPVFVNDPSRITWGIVGVFVIAWLWTSKEIVVASIGLNRSARTGAQCASRADADKDLGKIEWLADAQEYLVGLGLIGTVVGFIIALGGIDQNSIQNASGAQTAVAQLMQGMRVALNTTVLGASLALWHGVNLRMLQTALSNYWNDRRVASPQEGRS